MTLSDSRDSISIIDEKISMCGYMAEGFTDSYNFVSMYDLKKYADNNYKFFIDDVAYEIPFPRVISKRDIKRSKKILSDYLDRLVEIVNFIDTHDNILIHCHKGMSRSAFVYLFYKITKKHDLFESLKHLKEMRPRVCIGEDFVLALAIYEYYFNKTVNLKKINLRV